MTHKGGVNKNLAKATVMITNFSKTSGGTGVILESGEDSSFILTNKHVCGVVTNGGLVIADDNFDHLVVSAVASKSHDLCLIQVSANLHVHSTVAAQSPAPYDKATIYGHPHLFPSIITEGYFSQKKIIQVMIGTRPCTEEDLLNPGNSIGCAFFGVVPLVGTYESIVVSATIQAGSSGSAIYNDRGEIAALVFAGEGDLGYAFAVPLEYIHHFLNVEILGQIK